MAFNLAEFDHTAYNAKTDLYRYITAYGQELVTISIGSSMQIFPDVRASERVFEETTGDQGRFIAAVGTEAVTESVGQALMTVFLVTGMTETVTNASSIESETYLAVPMAETVAEDIAIGSNIFLSEVFNETVTERTALGSKSYINAEGYELVSESASLISMETKTCVLTLTLKPGQRLVVDAETYTVLLDGKNAIELQSGDWIDELSRETTDITISAASGVTNLSASIVYTERYL